MSLGERIAEMRRKAGLTLEELAKKCGSTKQYIGALEKGQKENPSAKLLYQIAKELNTTVEYLLTGNINLKLPDASNLEPELQEIFFELVQDPNSQTMFRAKKELTKEDLKSILKFIKYITHLAKQKQE
ncbi:MAG: helix-turn-helix transcriptional regulator [Thermoanaerobacteraceae bacterium]|nr:helix-turn-helix transcriptional regulator [Thermoanaerobacteraceae bacterium]